MRRRPRTQPDPGAAPPSEAGRPSPGPNAERAARAAALGLAVTRAYAARLADDPTRDAVRAVAAQFAVSRHSVRRYLRTHAAEVWGTTWEAARQAAGTARAAGRAAQEAAVAEYLATRGAGRRRAPHRVTDIAARHGLSVTVLHELLREREAAAPAAVPARVRVTPAVEAAIAALGDAPARDVSAATGVPVATVERVRRVLRTRAAHLARPPRPPDAP